jgi:membrane associated rhomboid family serine protease
MVSAAVGFQCPECVRAGAREQRAPRTTFGGRVSSDQGVVTKFIVGLCVLVFLAQQVPSLGVESRFWLVGLQFEPGGFGGVAAGQWYRLVTTAFLHGGFLHIALNMYVLWLFGPPLEAAFGRARFVALYVLAALGGSAASYAFGHPGVPSVGASGAIFGLFAAHIVVSRKLGRDATQLWVLLAINVALGFIVANIDWRAHLGGLLVGGAVSWAFAYAPATRRTAVHTLACVAALVAVVGLVVWRTGDLWSVPPTDVVSCAVSSPLDAGTFPECVRPG